MVSVPVDIAKVRQGIEALTAKKELRDDRAHAWDDPVWFVHDYLGRPTFDKQDEIISSVKENRRTAVKGANASGKDYMSGNILNWWEFVHDDGIVIVYGPTMRQVQEIIWLEARRAFSGSLKWLPGHMYPRAPHYYIDDYRYAQGFSAKPDEQGTGIQGFHSPNTLLIITEAHAINAAEIDALIRLNPSRVLMTGNTLVTAGEFYEAFFEKTWLYNGITISAFDTPNIRQQDNMIPGMIQQVDVDETAREYGIDHPMYYAKILAEFPDTLEDTVLGRRALMDAVERRHEAVEANEDDVLPKASLACDVARFGDDDTVAYRRQGRHNQVVWRAHGQDLMRIAGALRLMCEEDPEIDTVIIDDTGLGGGVTDRLREEPIRGGAVRVVAFLGGSRAVNRRRYVNLISEAWSEAAKAFKADPTNGAEPQITIDNNQRLIGQLASRKYIIQGDARIRLEPKRDYKKRTRQSPDDADAFVMNYSPMATRSWGIAI